jgi:hypothetical protein
VHFALGQLPLRFGTTHIALWDKLLPEPQIGAQELGDRLQPINFMSRSISARIKPKARTTPAWPAAARG